MASKRERGRGGWKARIQALKGKVRDLKSRLREEEMRGKIIDVCKLLTLLAIGFVVIIFFQLIVLTLLIVFVAPLLVVP